MDWTTDQYKNLVKFLIRTASSLRTVELCFVASFVSLAGM